MRSLNLMFNDCFLGVEETFINSSVSQREHFHVSVLCQCFIKALSQDVTLRLIQNSVWGKMLCHLKDQHICGQKTKKSLTSNIRLRQIWHASVPVMCIIRHPRSEQPAVLCSQSRIISTLHEEWQTDNKVWQGSRKHLGFTLISVTWHAWKRGSETE